MKFFNEDEGIKLFLKSNPKVCLNFGYEIFSGHDAAVCFDAGYFAQRHNLNDEILINQTFLTKS
ncbi:hypothetical protein MnBA_38080 [Marinobacterium sp. BA1]